MLSAKKPLRVGVIGVGHVGRSHARIYSELESCELVGIVDINPARAKEIAQIQQVRSYQNYQDLFGQVEAVSIAVPTVEHHRIGIDCLQAGLHVLIEKPLATTLQEADELVSLAMAKGLILQVGHLERFNPAVQVLNRLAKNPGFIEAYRISGFPDRSIDIDVIMDLMIHDIDIILNLVSSPIKQIQAIGVPVLTQKVDIANARIQFESGCVANLTASRVSLKQERKLRVFQKERYLSLDYQAQELTLAELKYPETFSVDRNDPSTNLGHRLNRYEQTTKACPELDEEVVPMDRPEIIVQKVEITKGEPLKIELASLVDCIVHKKNPQVSGEAGRKALEVAIEVSENIKCLNSAA